MSWSASFIRRNLASWVRGELYTGKGEGGGGAVVDRRVVVAGSFNWTSQVVVYQVLLKFLHRFPSFLSSNDIPYILTAEDNVPWSLLVLTKSVLLAIIKHVTV